VAKDHARVLFQDVFAGRVDRRQLLRRAGALGLTAPVVGALLNASRMSALGAEEGQLKVTYYDWILANHSPITNVDEEQGAEANVANSARFSTDVFVTEAADKKSTWDFYIGVTPFLEMIQLAESGIIEPWDPYLPEGMLDNIVPAVRAEATYKDQLYVWPFLLDVTVQGWNADIVGRAELDPEAAPANWDEYLANARQIVDSGAAPFGCTFDFHSWRSLIPITHSISTDVYEENGLFRWNSDAAVQALELMKQMTELANPDVLNEGTTDGGVNSNPDEGAFAAQQAGYYIKYQNAHLRFAGAWEDPSQLRLAALPVAEGGDGGTVFWSTGAVLLKYGLNKEAAAEYMDTLSNDQRIWEHSVTGNPPEETAVGHLPVLTSIWDEYTANRPEWITDWAFSIYNGLESAKAIAPTKLSITQFDVAAPFYVAYLKGEESDAKAAMDKAMDAVTAELEKAAS